MRKVIQYRYTLLSSIVKTYNFIECISYINNVIKVYVVKLFVLLKYINIVRYLALSWFTSYLSDRSSSVKIYKEVFTISYEIWCSQGSVLFPPLVFIYLYPLPSIIFKYPNILPSIFR